MFIEPGSRWDTPNSNLTIGSISGGNSRRLKQLVADQALDIQMLKFVAEGNW
jgi:hypothetical protein